MIGLSCQERFVKDKASEDALIKLQANDSISKNETHYTNDSVFLLNDLDTIWLSNTDLYLIENEFTEITSKFKISHPDIAYSKSRNDISSSKKSKYFEENFSSLAGQDYYYKLYAYYLKNRNKSNKYQNERNTLNNLLLLLNDFMAIKAGGGSYYAHRFTRIPAYVEFEVYKLNSTSHSLNQLNMNNKKKLIKMLKIKEKTNEEINYELVGLTKEEMEGELRDISLTIDKLIINDFYLNKCLDFFLIED